MCGIWAYISQNYNDKINSLFVDFMKIKHRGPDYSSFQNYNNVLVGFHRLSIMDLSFKSNQPYTLCKDNRTIVFVCNGEIYNYKELIEKFNLDIKSKSDCLTIPELYLKFEYQQFVELFHKEIKGEFAFLLFEFDQYNNLQYVITGRDMIGIRPLYYSEPKENTDMIFCSEIKAASSYPNKVIEFPPGQIHKFHYRNNLMYMIDLFSFDFIYNLPFMSNNESGLLKMVKNSVIKSISRRLDSDQPIAFLLSGGVDSSLVAAVSAALSGKKIKTFCCGMSQGSDLKYAKMVAEHIGSEHTEVIFTPEDALNAIDDVIYTIETWDTTTIRASVGQYLVSKYISQNTDTKVLFVGEGPDEVCSSYLFNWYSPDPKLIHTTALEYVKEIHAFDVKRADRCIARWGLEARVSLLDPEFIETYWLIPSEWRDPKYKNMEKWWLRKAFEEDNILPPEVLWRKKEAFSDGISSTEKSWFQMIQEHIKEKYYMEEKEYFKMKFIEYFGEKRLNIIPHYWQPKWNKDGSEVKEYVDPSARTLEIYNS
jgi:asparagine synthase (glutamine-hydrolysing)